MGKNRQQGHEDPLSRLHKAHFAIAQILLQVDDLVQKAHRLSVHKQISSLDLCNFSELLETTASSLQEWIPRFKNTSHKECTEDPACHNDGISTLMQKIKGGDKEQNEAGKGKIFVSVQSNTSERLQDVDVMLAGKENVLSDSPLVPWLDKVQFFILTPMAKQKKAVSPPVLSSRSSFKGQKSLSQDRVVYAHAGIIPVNLSPSLDTCADIMQDMPSSPKLPLMSALDSCMNEEESILENVLVSAAATPSHVVQQLSVEGTDSTDMASPSCFQSLVKRYSNYFETREDFSDSSSTPPVTPTAKQKQVSQEGMEITDYFTAFSPPKSIAPYISRSERSPNSLLSVHTSPQSKAGVNDVDHNTPMPFQSLVKRYSQFLHTKEEKNEMIDPALTLTPMLVSSPPKTCILMRPNRKDAAANSRKSIQTPLLLLKSPFRTPGLDLKKAIDHVFYEDMDLTSLRKPRLPPLPPDSERTPSSDMQFATIRKALNSIKRTPLVDLQLSAVRKPEAPLPGEQTLKRELWCRMEAEFASMAHVCKSLFSDSQMEAPDNTKVERAGVENRQQKGASKSKLSSRGMQRRGSSMY